MAVHTQPGCHLVELCAGAMLASAEFTWRSQEGIVLHGWTARWQQRLTSENSWVSGEVTPCSFTKKSSSSLQRPGVHLCVVTKHRYNPHSQFIGGGGYPSAQVCMNWVLYGREADGHHPPEKGISTVDGGIAG